MILNKEQAIFKAERSFAEMVQFVTESAREGKPIDEVERELWQRLRNTGRGFLQGYVEMQGNGDLGATLEYEGRTARRLEGVKTRRYVSVFGELEIKRCVYGTREFQKHEVIPLDARLSLPESEFSCLLQEWDQAFCVQGSYEASRGTVERILGIGQPVRTLERMNQAMAGDVEGYRAQRPKPEPVQEGEILVLTADGKGVPMRRSEAGPGKKRQACVGSVYTIDPFPRTSADVVNEILRKETQKERPTPREKQLRAELTRTVEGEEVNGKEAIFQWFQAELEQRNLGDETPVICVMDGERALWTRLKDHVKKVVCILDIFHVLQRLWTAAECFCEPESEEAREFVTDRLFRILEGDVGRVIGGLKQMATKKNVKGTRKERLEKVIGYLHNNRDKMRYHEYLKAGYPIGSGVAEGACRHLVKDRMELTGMRWQVEGAQAMLDLRAVYLNGEWDQLQQYRAASHQSRLYPYREMVNTAWPVAA